MCHTHTHTQTYVPACTQNNFCATSSQVTPAPPLPPPLLALHLPSSQHTQLHPGPITLPSPFPLARPHLAHWHYEPVRSGSTRWDSPLAPGCIRYVYRYACMHICIIYVSMYAYGYVCVCACMYTLTHSLILSLSPAYTGCKPRHRRRGLEESATLRLRTPHHTRRTCSHTTPGTLERGVERGDSEREVRPHLVQELRSWWWRRTQYRSGPPGPQPPQKPSKRHTPLGHELAIWSRCTWARRRGHQTLWEHAREHEIAPFRSLCLSRKGEQADGVVMKVVASSCLLGFYFILFFI